MSLTSAIKDFALDQGYCNVGVTTAEPFQEFTEALQSRKDQFDFLLKRPGNPVAGASPKNVMPGARSVISLTYDYMRVSCPESLSRHVGRAYLARCYVTPQDRLNGSRLKLMRDYVESLGCKINPDIFLPERWAAARSGTATFGRNNFGYSTGLGSFVIFYSIVVDKELEYDSPTLEIGCPPGCRACMDACPTRAIYEPNKLDPKRCIGFNHWANVANLPTAPYLTGYIDHGIRAAMGVRIHGCDLCQEVCPRNRKQLNRAVPEDRFLEMMAPDFTLENLLVMDDDFNRRRVQPIMYNYIRDKKYFQRNAAIAMGNAGDPKYLPHLEKAVKSDPEPLVRGHAAWAIGRIDASGSRGILESALGSEPDQVVASEIKMALAGSVCPAKGDMP